MSAFGSHAEDRWDDASGFDETDPVDRVRQFAAVGEVDWGDQPSGEPGDQGEPTPDELARGDRTAGRGVHAEPAEGPTIDLTWHVERSRARAGVLHGRALPDDGRRTVWVQEVDRPALVLGSTQDEGLVDHRMAAALGIEVVRRRSGGGVVLLVPGEVAWLDVIVPHGDPLWHDDVGRAGEWLGRAWQAALVELGITGTRLHRGPLACGALGRLVCFAAVGPGEVTLGERKVVGVSQRRTRTAARFQCAVYRRWAPELLVPLLGLDEDIGRGLQAAAVGVGAPPTEMVEAFLRHLPA